MNGKKSFLIPLAGFLVMLVACEKTITPEVATQPAKLVVEAQVENGRQPLVILSNSLNYFSEIDSTMLLNSYVHDAKVTVSDGRKTVELREFRGVTASGVRYYFYSTSATPPYDTLSGIPGRSYQLSITTGGQQYTASTLLPVLAKTIDSLWWKKAPFISDTTNVILMARITDPPGLGNYIRYFTQVNNRGFFAARNSVFDDQIVDGTRYDIQVDQAPERRDLPRSDDFGYFKRGDTATIRFCNIDKPSYEFWRTWEFNIASIGNPFSSPGKVLGNISNGALGAFCGYSVQYKTLIIPK